VSAQVKPARKLTLVARDGRHVSGPYTLTDSQSEEAGETTPPARFTGPAKRNPPPVPVNYYVALSDIVRFDDLALIVVTAGAAFFAAHIALAIQTGAGVWAVFGGGL
jgi:hypothetical protein